MILADSILQTASMARCVSVTVTATDHTTFDPPVQAGATKPLLRGPGTLLWFGSEVFRPEHLANFGFTLPARPVFLVKFHEIPGSLERLFF